MTDVNLEAVFPALKNQATRLNEASDHANRTLAAIEQRLVNFNIGLEVWHSKPLHVTDSEGDLSPDATSSRIIQFFGLARVDGKWCLAVKQIRLVSGFFEGDTNCPFQDPYAAGPLTPLLNSSRALRITAMQMMPEFLVQLGEHITATTDELEAATSQMQ